jgi:hypothetical protein
MSQGASRSELDVEFELYSRSVNEWQAVGQKGARVGLMVFLREIFLA